MILKRAEIFGFKSFGRRVVIEFDEAITGIVGPNGSGKSNIVDAIRWAIGEQRVKSLRGNKMEDVIFSGTEIRRALGYAQVSLILDNISRSFPIDYDEINVTRKLYRSGESVYSINKTVCRLRDVQELFMDTGLGREGYSIVSQGQIDSIITGSPLERKLLIEEAVGIVKYKVRKIESEKKLERAQNNLYRITDILAEIETRLPVLKRQSEKAQNYVNLREELRELETGVFADRMDSLTEQLNKHVFSKKTFDESSLRLEEEIESAAARYEFLKEELQSFETKLSEANAKTHELISGSENSKASLQVALSRIESLTVQTEQREKEAEDIGIQLEESLLLSRQLLADSERISGQLITAQEELSQAKDICTAFEEKRTESEKASAEHRNLLENEKEKLGSVQNTQNETASNIEKLRYICTRLEEEEARNISRISEIESLAESGDELSESLRKAEESYESAKQAQQSLKKKHEQMHSELLELMPVLQSEQSKLKVLKGYESSLQGYRFGVRKIMELRNSRNLHQKIFGTVSDLISTDDRFSQAITRALGGAGEYVAVDNENTAASMISILKSNSWGRVTFYPLNIIRPPREHLSAMDGMEGYIAPASSLVRYDAQFESVITDLLGRTAVADTIEHANVIAKKTNYRYKIVTLDGEVLFPGGAIVGGRIKDDDGGVLKRRNEIEALEKSSAEKAEIYDRLIAGRSSLEEELEKLSEQAAEAEENYSKLKDAHRAQSLRNSSLSDEKETLLGASVRNKNELAALNEQIKEFEAKRDLLAVRAEELKKSTDEMSLYAAENDTAAVDNEYLKAIESRNAAEIKAVKINEESARTAERISSEKARAESLEKDRLKRRQENEDAQKEIVRLRASAKELSGNSEEYEASRTRLNEQFALLTEQKNRSNAEYMHINERIVEMSRNRAEISEQIYKTENLIAKAEMEMTHLQQNMMEEYSLTYAQVSENRTKRDQKECQKRIAELKNEIRKLGNINADAVEEFKELKTRFDTMTVQRDDLINSKNELEKVIRDVMLSMSHQFSVQFDLIQKEFGRVFRKLFSGGEARLILTDPGDIGESGIDIVAQPPKTKLKNISALSGGEKAMCALALIMAIFSIKPSPFCLFDEVDAPLDDANVIRFCSYIRDIRDQNQFVVITHKRKTMEICDSLYGASMGTDGVTKILSVRLSQINNKGEVDV